MDSGHEGTLGGAVALAGSGEYTPAMRETDLALLATVGGPAAARVVVLPTAAGREAPESPARWARMGLEHFAALGAAVEAALILQRSDAEDPRWLPLLEAADFYYFSGGDPGHVVATLRDTSAWAAIRRRHAAGAVLAGCSAGAMAFGGWTPRRPSLGHGTCEPGLGVLPHLVTLPHFDQMGRFLAPRVVGLAGRSLPSDVIVVGVDENTALLRRAAEGADGPVRWEVSGRQTVTVFGGPDRTTKTVYQTGDVVPLPPA